MDIVSTVDLVDIVDIMGYEAPLDALTKTVLADYHTCVFSRSISELSFYDVLSKNRAQFAIVGDGKELPQIALAKQFKNGDWRAGYYRDQTLAMAAGFATPFQLFTQLYANTNPLEEPQSAGRMMNAHFATNSLDEQGNWQNLMAQPNSSADMSSTASQMPRAIGLALASKKYREIIALQDVAGIEQFSNNGNEICYCTIGDASTSEGHFWEALNAAGVLKIPLVISVWDDGMGISVERKYQTTKNSISEATAGFGINEKGEGIKIYVVKGWDYPALCRTYRQAAEQARRYHIPVLVHVQNLTQPFGHSTSGGDPKRGAPHKTPERKQYEIDFDCNVLFKKWILDNQLATEAELNAIETAAAQTASDVREEAWKATNLPILNYLSQLNDILVHLEPLVSQPEIVDQYRKDARIRVTKQTNPSKRDLAQVARQLLVALKNEPAHIIEPLRKWTAEFQKTNRKTYNTYLYSQSEQSAMNVAEVKPIYTPEAETVPGKKVLNAFFDIAFAQNPMLITFGEDVGKIGDVDGCLSGLQKKYGVERIFDTGIRELSIMGQGIGLALRGFRPIAEIQYLDYFLYGLQPIADDLASLHYRTYGGQKAPLIIRTRGHRLVGIWHSGSPMGMLLGSVRGIHLLVPRNMTQAAGFYNTLLKSDEPGIVVECLNGYSKREQMPTNIADICVPLGVPEVLRTGTDITIVTYGACCAIALDAAERLATCNINCEVIDVQSLLPFDRYGIIGQSLEKTNRILFLDEDVPGGATAFMLQQVLEVQNGYRWLDSPPQTLAASEHRPAYGFSGDYYSKPNSDDVFDKVYTMMNESNPTDYPIFF